MRTRIAIALSLFACGDDGHQPIDAPPEDVPPIDMAPPDPFTTVLEFPTTPTRNVDLLFVIDDSPSMADKQANLTANFPNFINHLQSVTGGLPNLHLGVISTDMGTKGTGSSAPGPSIGSVGNGGCSGIGDGGALQLNGAPVTGTFLRDVALAGGARERNYTGTLVDAFGQMARLGMGGCGFEQPLHAMRRALDGNPANAGFVRPDALLAVVFVTDEDDCSITDPAVLGPESAAIGPQQSFRCTRFGVTCAQGGVTTDAMNQVGAKSQCTARTGSYLDEVAPYRDFLVQLKGDVRNVVVGGIVGNNEPVLVETRSLPAGGTATAVAHSCTYQGANGTEVADPAVRLVQFLEQFPNRFTWSSICQADLVSPLQLLADLVNQAIGSPCLGATTIPAGTDCYVEDVVGTTATRLDACGSAPCFRIVTDATTCTTGGHQKLEVMRTAAPAPATVTRLRCAL